MAFDVEEQELVVVPVVLSTAWGTVVVTAVDPAAEALSSLPMAEQALTVPFAARRRATFVAGRWALRIALTHAGLIDEPLDVGAILRDDRGAPALPPDLARRCRVSISHKDTHAAALVSRVAGDRVVGDRVEEASADGPGVSRCDDNPAVGAFVGVDLEIDEGQSRARIDAIARQTLRPEELQALPDDDDLRRNAVLVHFSAKEALYKSIDPFLRRYVGFHEVSVDIVGQTLAFRCPEGCGLEATGLRLETDDPRVVLTLARARRGGPR